VFELAGGAIADHKSCIPQSNREAAWHVTALHQWSAESEQPKSVDLGIEWVEEALNPVSVGGTFPSLLGGDEKPERVKGSYGENWERLRKLKKKYDPDGVFSNSFWPTED